MDDLEKRFFVATSVLEQKGLGFEERRLETAPEVQEKPVARTASLYEEIQAQRAAATAEFNERFRHSMKKCELFLWSEVVAV